MEITIIGGGLAGAEAAWQIARRGERVTLYEMRPGAYTPAHTTPLLSELVCSNSLKSQDLTNAHGLLKEELRRLHSIIIEAADRTSIPGGKALVVDRTKFATMITEKIEAHPLIEVIREEVKEMPPGIVIIATGPLTSDGLAERIREITGKENLSFFDAISPIVDGETIDMEKVFFGSRYMEGTDDYLNCPLTRDEYDAFYDALITAERVSLREFEKVPYFEGCLPIEIMAERGRKTLAFGPMKPVGLPDPSTQKRYYAVVQLRREDASGSMYNLVGFQTKLTYKEQERVFGMIPGLHHAAFLRHGSIHRNTYINSPSVLTSSLQCAHMNRIFFAGQITGVEGYVESTAMGLIAGISAYMYLKGIPFEPPPDDTCTSALLQYITTERKNFQPMNVNFGLLKNYNKKEKEKTIHRALESISLWGRAMEPSAGYPNRPSALLAPDGMDT
ncbi:MAG: methylenetetrahydrofolate--tRNA-(uracil(54)-C(5))-methyltransferase (FADH(2)-oxidizing) TrmFO [Syntrophus sp. (in: bacteria)]|nr:methylenetetrahydrofolate--tRNA-(uracil(54)-C(5))-methyltransferase (FADH(2)-oxidizing) TrmFO [Syntrophus sp. (in: bacteria)]